MAGRDLNGESLKWERWAIHLVEEEKRQKECLDDLFSKHDELVDLIRNLQIDCARMGERLGRVGIFAALGGMLVFVPVVIMAILQFMRATP